MSPHAILGECEDAQELRATFEIICVTPRHDAATPRRWGHRALIALLAFLVLSYAFGLVEAVTNHEPILPSLIGFLGNCIVIFGVQRRRLAAYVGLPLWAVFMAIGELRAAGALSGSQEDSWILGITLGMLVIIVALAVRRRQYLFPFSTWRGIPRSADGTVIIPAQLLSREGAV